MYYSIKIKKLTFENKDRDMRIIKNILNHKNLDWQKLI